MGEDAIRSVEEVNAEYARCNDKEALDGVQTYCTFIGYPYSGHSLIGSLLDAHPNMILAHELHALGYVKAGFSQQLLFYLLLENSRAFTAEGRTWNGYHYAVPNQWQGRYRELRVIGDKKGAGSSRELKANPEMLDALARAVPIRRKFIHVVRNPFDSISTINKRMFPNLRVAARFFFSLAESVAAVSSRLSKDELFSLRHEEFVARPKQVLSKLCSFLGEEASADYLADCASIVREQPNKSRLSVPWTSEQQQKVQWHINRFPFFAGYNFDS